MRTVAPISPGEMLEEEFLKPLGLSKYRLAKDIGVPAQRIGDIVAGKRAITADTDLRLCRYFGLSDGWWLRGQATTASWGRGLRSCETTFVLSKYKGRHPIRAMARRLT